MKIAPMRLLLLALLLFTSTGCAVFRANELGDIGPWPPIATGSQSRAVSLKMVPTAQFNGDEIVPHDQVIGAWREQAVLAYRDSGLFSAVEFGKFAEETPITAQINLRNVGEANLVMAFLTGFTMFLIPCSGTDHFTMNTEFFDAAGRPIGTITKSESAKLWLHLFMIPFSAGRMPEATYESILFDLNRATIIEAAERGYFR